MYLRFRGTLPCGVRFCHFTSLDTLSSRVPRAHPSSHHWPYRVHSLNCDYLTSGWTHSPPSPPHTLATPQSAGPASLHTCLFNSWFCLFLLNYKLLCCVKFVAFILFRVNTREIMWRVLVTQRKIVDLINIGLESDTVTVLTIFKIGTLPSRSMS